MNLIRRHLAQPWIIAVMHYVRVYAAIVAFGTTLGIIIQRPDYTTDIWVGPGILAAGMTLIVTGTIIILVLDDIHRRNPEKCRWCRRLRKRITHPDRPARFATNQYHGPVHLILVVAIPAFLVVGVITNDIWHIMAANSTMGIICIMSGLHARYRHVCTRCTPIAP